MRPKNPILSMLLFSALMILIILIMQPLNVWHFGDKIAVLFPKGSIAIEQRNILFIVQALMLLVIIPVYILTFIFCWIYRADNKHAKYEPELSDSFLAECIWWGLPTLIVLIISILTWIKTEELDPFKPLPSENKEMRIQVVALQWKWLFIYPEEKIATINYIQIPKERPIRFELSANAPMNSFWIPSLGGQIYAMPGMETILYLIANEEGDFRGSSANISGKGFSGMVFNVRASSSDDFQKWVKEAKEAKNSLNEKTYEALSLPSENNKVEIFQLEDQNLFKNIVNTYM